MELYLVVLLVAAASAGSNQYYHYVPQTYTVQTQQLPTLYQTVHTQAHQIPTVYKVHNDDDDDDDEDDDDNVDTFVYTVPQHVGLVKPVQYQQIKTEVQQPIQHRLINTQVQPIVQYQQVRHIRDRRSADADDVSAEDDSTEKVVSEKFALHSVENLEVKNTNSHFLNLLTNKPQTTQVNPLVQYVKTSGNVFPHTPVNNVATTLIRNAQPAIQVPQVQFVNTPTYRTIQTVNPVHTPLINTINTPVFQAVATPFVQTPVFKTLQAQDIVNNVQTPVQVVQTPVQYVQTPVHVQTVQTPTVYTTLNNQAFAPVQLVHQPIFKTVETPVVQTVVQKEVRLTPGYVAANHGAVHTAPLPEGPANDGFFASHHINLPNAKA